jgi:hypothetical protein
MADLSESSEFPEGIYQIETTDPVIGGAPNVATRAGLSNIPHQLLANRTRWLRDAFDSLVGGLTDLVTRPQFDSTGRPATTEFVRREIGNLRGQVTLTAGGALGPDHVGMRVLIQTNGAITLPLLSSVPAGAAFLLVAGSGYTPTILASGADTIAVAGTASAVVLPGRGSLVLVAGSAGWAGDLGDVALSNSPLFGASLTNPGYQRLPSGLILQFGGGNAPGGAVTTMAFPIAFPAACLALAFGDYNSGPEAGNAHIISYTTITASGFEVTSWRHDGVQEGSSFSYMAIGH